MMLRKDIYEYIAKVKETRTKLKYQIPKYQYLLAAFEVISSDFFDPGLRKNMSKRDPVLYRHI
jgi:hypothetical protein